MKSLPLLTAFLLLTLACSQSDKSGSKEEPKDNTIETSIDDKKDERPEKRIFDIEGAKIVFNYTGPETGTETLYFEDYGETAVLMIDTKTQNHINRQTIIWKDDKSTMVNHEKKLVSKSPFRPKGTEPPGIAEIDDDARKGIGYEKMPNETIAGKSCEVWFNANLNVKYWLWNKVDLKLENQGVYTKEATSVEEISEIPASVMAIPADYQQR